MAQNMNQANISLLPLWKSLGNSGDMPTGWNGPGGSASNPGGGNGGSVNIPAFNFDYNAAEADARAKLEPYYKQKLADAKGDVELAKKYIEEDYATGMRTAQEDQQSQNASDALTARDETNTATEALNKRGLLFGQNTNENTSAAPLSDLAQNQVMNPLQQKQQLRKQAIDRAIARQEEVAQTTRDRGITAQDTQYPRTEQQILEDENNQVETQYVPMAYERAKDAYDNTYAQSLNQAVNRSVNANPYLQALGFGG